MDLGLDKCGYSLSFILELSGVCQWEGWSGFPTNLRRRWDEADAVGEIHLHSRRSERRGCIAEQYM